MPKGDRLTKKQEAFVREYIKSRNATDAYRKAYDAKDMSDNAIWSEASKLLKHPKVAPRIEVVVEKAITRAALTVESILDELEEARQMAKAKENPSAMAQASMGKAKVGGLIVEKREIGGPGQFENMSDEELDAIIQSKLNALDGDAIH